MGFEVGPSTEDKSKLLSAVLIRGDLAGLSEFEKLSHLKSVCESLGLNPLTNPFRYLSLNGKLVLYAGRDATDQLRKIHNVNVEIISREMHGDCFVVTARAKLGNGRSDESVGAVFLGKATGDVLANLYMKAETKAKRRVTLSICGLGMLDETEVETVEAPPNVARHHSHGGLPNEIAGKAIDALQKAREKIYQLALQEGLGSDTVKAILMERYRKDSSLELNLSELEDLAKYLEK